MIILMDVIIAWIISWNAILCVPVENAAEVLHHDPQQVSLRDVREISLR
jgi:hypothetical protein